VTWLWKVYTICAVARRCPRHFGKRNVSRIVVLWSVQNTGKLPVQFHSKIRTLDDWSHISVAEIPYLQYMLNHDDSGITSSKRTVVRTCDFSGQQQEHLKPSVTGSFINVQTTTIVITVFVALSLLSD
jgi:hypothetical protein